MLRQPTAILQTKSLSVSHELENSRLSKASKAFSPSPPLQLRPTSPPSSIPSMPEQTSASHCKRARFRRVVAAFAGAQLPSSSCLHTTCT